MHLGTKPVSMCFKILTQKLQITRNWILLGLISASRLKGGSNSMNIEIQKKIHKLSNKSNILNLDTYLIGLNQSEWRSFLNELIFVATQAGATLDDFRHVGNK